MSLTSQHEECVETQYFSLIDLSTPHGLVARTPGPRVFAHDSMQLPEELGYADVLPMIWDAQQRRVDTCFKHTDSDCHSVSYSANPQHIHNDTYAGYMWTVSTEHASESFDLYLVAMFPDGEEPSRQPTKFAIRLERRGHGYIFTIATGEENPECVPALIGFRSVYVRT